MSQEHHDSTLNEWLNQGRQLLASLTTERGRLRGELAEIERRIDQLATVIRPTSATTSTRHRARSTSSGIPMQPAVLRVVRGTPDRSMHVDEILAAAQALGATTNSARPVDVIETALYHWKNKGMPIVKVGVRQWQWIDGESGSVQNPAPADQDQRGGEE